MPSSNLTRVIVYVGYIYTWKPIKSYLSCYISDQRLEERKARNEIATVREHVQAVSGTRVAKLLDFLSSELVRLQDERRCHAFTMLAERKVS